MRVPSQHRKRCKICSKLTRKIPLMLFWCLYCLLWTVSHLFLVFPLLTLSKYLLAGQPLKLHVNLVNYLNCLKDLFNVPYIYTCWRVSGPYLKWVVFKVFQKSCNTCYHFNCSDEELLTMSCLITINWVALLVKNRCSYLS